MSLCLSRRLTSISIAIGLGLGSLVLVPPTAIAAPSEFISTWTTTAANESITLPLYNGGTYNFTVDWETDGTIDDTITAWNDPNTTHTYATAGTYTVTISGAITGWSFNGGGDRNKIVGISQWGNFNPGNNGGAFQGCENLVVTATDAPNLTGVTILRDTFRDATSLTNPDFSSWNTALVTSMEGMFSGATLFNGNVSGWNTANVTTMREMFNNARAFNQPIGSWNTANVTRMDSTFSGARAFNQPIDNWITGSVTTMYEMFNGARAFNQPVGSWNTSSVQGNGMYGMFASASAFNQPIGNWDTDQVTDMGDMFNNASAFNQSLADLNLAGMAAGNLRGFMTSTAMTALNVDLTLAGWAATAPNGVSLNMGTSSGVNVGRNNFYTQGSGSVSRASLVTTKGWTISGGNLISTTHSLTPQIAATMNAGDSQTFSLTLKDDSNVAFAVNPRSSLVATPTLAGATAGAVTYNNAANNGTYTFQYTAPANVGSGSVDDTISLTVNGQAIVTPIRVTIAPAPAPGPGPAPVLPPSAPRDVSGVPGNAEVVVSWQPPSYSGSFPVTDYRVVASPGGALCLAKAPALTCTVTGLTNGTAYTFVVTALNGAGWGAPSTASAPVTPTAPVVRSLTLFEGQRVSDGRHDRIRTAGTSTGIPAGSRLTPWIRYGATGEFKQGVASIVVDDTGGFTWTRQIRKDRSFQAYVAFEDLESNRVIWKRVR